MDKATNKILHLFHFEGLTYKQIALRLSSGNQYGVYKNLSSDAVNSQLKRARAKIRAFFPISEKEGN